MANNDIDHNEPHYCPVYDREIGVELCYESLCCLARYFKVSSVEELHRIRDIEKARSICKACPYSDLS